MRPFEVEDYAGCKMGHWSCRSAIQPLLPDVVRIVVVMDEGDCPAVRRPGEITRLCVPGQFEALRRRAACDRHDGHVLTPALMGNIGARDPLPVGRDG